MGVKRLAVNKKLLLIGLLTILLVFSGCTEDSNQMPNDFNFSLTYGTYGKQLIDTFNNVVVKDLIEDGTIETELILSEEEMKQIYVRMQELDIMGELDLDRDKDCIIEPPSVSNWTIQMNNQTKTISLPTYCDYPDHARELLRLEEFIHELVSEREEYQALPDSVGVYE